MGFDNFKSQLLKELIFPKTLIVDRPGIITNRRVSRFSKKSNMTRVVYMFEKFAIDLYSGAAKKLGKEKADFLWYKISKDSVVRYMMFSGEAKVPEFLIPSVLKYVFESLAHIGVSFAESFEFEGKSIVTYGKNCFVCRKAGSGCISAGHLSAIWSHMHGENIEAEACCGVCPKECKIRANKSIPKKYDVDYEFLRPMKKYNLANFKGDDFETPHSKATFGDFVKFGKIKCDNDKKVFYFRGEAIAHIEVGLMELIYQEYKRIGEEKLFNDILVKSAEELMEKFCSGNIKKDLREMESLLSAFGWGIPIRLQKKGKIRYSFIHPPVCRYPPILRATVLNGFLNSILKRKFRVEKAIVSEFVFKEF